MKRLNKQNGMYALLVAVAAMIGITIYGSCSADEDIWGFDNEYPSLENTRSEVKDMSEYLTLSTYDPTKWTYEENVIIQKALNRMTLTSKDGLGFIQETKGGELNMSEELFNLIKKGFEDGNALMKESYQGTNNKKKNARRKTRDPEGNMHFCTGQDCVGHSIAYYLNYDIEYVNNVIHNDLLSYPELDVPKEDLEYTLRLFHPFIRQNYFHPIDAVFPYLISGIILIPNHAINGYCIYLNGNDHILFCYDDQKKKWVFGSLPARKCADDPRYVTSTSFGYYK